MPSWALVGDRPGLRLASYGRAAGRVLEGRCGDDLAADRCHRETDSGPVGRGARTRAAVPGDIDGAADGLRDLVPARRGT